jgi:dipeptidyl aminopeptidase/acylaminoacyl peptidase
MRRRLAIVAGVVVLILVSAYGVAAALVYNNVSSVEPHCAGHAAGVAANTPQHFTAVERPSFDAAPYQMSPPEDVTFPSRDANITISGWFVAADEPDAPAVVVVHGRNGCKRVESVLLPAGMLHRNGFSVLLIDLRDHGDSTVEDGRYAGGTEEYRDVLGAWDWLRVTKHIDASRIGLLGVSLGAASVLIAFGEEHGVAATWEDSSYADVEEAIRHELVNRHYPDFLEYGGVRMATLMSGDDLLAHTPIAEMHQLHGRPLFITHGDADETIDVGQAAKLEAAIRADGGDVESWIIHGAKHVEAMFLQTAEYERRLVAFFGRTIGRR